jgi:peroxiredoxin Q/BCP
MNIDKKAPSFTLLDENGRETSLDQFHGKNVVLFFYPKADTPG